MGTSGLTPSIHGVPALPPENHAVARLAAGQPVLRTSITGEPRGPLCGMGTCFECRATIAGVEHERTCQAPLERSPLAALPDRCDVLVVGAGPAGLAAARTAASHGKRVVLLDDNGGLGGQIWRGRRDLAVTGVHFVPRVTVLGPHGDDAVLVLADGARHTISFAAVILATGATERFLPFPGWTLPNVLGAGGLQALAKQGLPVAGKRIVVAGSGPLLLAVAAYLRSAGAKVLGVHEQTTKGKLARFLTTLVGKPGKLWQGATLGARLLGVPFVSDAWLVEARGDDRVREVRVHTRSGERTLACDYVACGFGLVPNVRLPVLFGARVADGCVVVDAELRTANPRVFCVGEATGVGGLDKAVLEGKVAGAVAAGDRTQARRRARALGRERAFVQALDVAYALRPELAKLARPDTIVCRCEDVPLAAISACSSWRDAKLQTRCGMGSCQGRVCGPAVAFLRGFAVGDARPPIFHAPLAALMIPQTTHEAH